MPKPTRTIMISATRKDLEQYCDHASRIITVVAAQRRHRIHLEKTSMETMSQTGEREYAVAISTEWVDQSDWVILIVGHNYGTISDEPGAMGYSVTEWEYRQAVNKDKKIFVFMVHADYSPAPGESNIALWGIKQSAEQRDKLLAFQALVAKPHTAFFRNLEDFDDQLLQTLHWAIDELPEPIGPGGLAVLMQKLSPAIRVRNLQVKRLADCKRIHDALHDVQDDTILTIRNIILPGWKKTPLSLPHELEGTLNNTWTKASRRLALIDELARGLDDSKSELKHLLGLASSFSDAKMKDSSCDADAPRALWDAVSRPSFDVFAETFNDFATTIQDAFESANRSMQEDADVLGSLQTVLLQQIAVTGGVLTPGDEALLRQEIGRVAEHHNRLQNTLHTHDKWQRIHDKLDGISRSRGTSEFAKGIARMAKAELITLETLANSALALGTSAPVDGASQAGDQPVTIGHPPRASAVTNSPDYFALLKEELLRLKPCIDALKLHADTNHFDEMQDPFDKTFLYIDKLTYAEVERARERVIDFNRFLEDLNTLAPGQ